MVNALLIRKSKTKREKAFYQELDEAAHHGYIDLRGIKLWYLVSKRITILTRLV